MPKLSNQELAIIAAQCATTVVAAAAETLTPEMAWQKPLGDLHSILRVDIFEFLRQSGE